MYSAVGAKNCMRINEFLKIAPQEVGSLTKNSVNMPLWLQALSVAKITLQ